MDGRWRVWRPVALALGCGPTPAGGGDGSSSGADPATAVTTTASVDDATTVGHPWMPGSSGGGDGSTAGANGSSSTGAGASTGGCVPGPIDCDGNIYQCGDELDNDGDGLVDFDDPDCTGPCDDAEDSLQTGLPGDNYDCTEDCFFDNNGGHGDDMCLDDLRCDPENPGALIGCVYNPGPGCMDPVQAPPACVAFCEPLVPPGCETNAACRATPTAASGASAWARPKTASRSPVPSATLAKRSATAARMPTATSAAATPSRWAEPTAGSVVACRA